MAIYTITKNYIEGTAGNESQLHNVILKFANPDCPHKVSLDKSKVLYNIYTDLSKNNNDIQTWLDWMTRTSELKFETINVDISKLSCDEEIYLRVAAATNRDKKIIVNSHQFWTKFNYLIDCSKIEYNGVEIEILDKSEILEELKEKNHSTTIINNNMKDKNNPWLSGTFYMFLAIIVISIIAAICHFLPWYSLPIILIASILLIGVIGAFQAKNDETLSEKGFLELMKETYKRLPLLKDIKKD